MRVLIIEDEIIIARFIEQQLAAHFECTTAIALDRKEVQDIISTFLPHLILCDINLQEESDGIELIAHLRQQYAFEVIFVTSYQSKSIIERAVKYQPLNYVIKPADEAAFFAVLKLAWPVITGNASLGRRKEDAKIQEVLSVVEWKIVQLILDNKSSQEIADLMFLSPYTIKNHRHRICRKLQLKDGNNALLKWALKNKELRG